MADKYWIAAVLHSLAQSLDPVPHEVNELKGPGMTTSPKALRFDDDTLYSGQQSIMEHHKVFSQP